MFAKIESVAPHILDPSFDAVRRVFDDACAQSAMRARAEQLQALNQVFRRFRGYQTESDWLQALLDAATPYAKHLAVFSVAKDIYTLRGQAPADWLKDDLSIPSNSAAAITSAVESKDPVTTLRSPNEVGEQLSEASERAHIFPITNGDRVSAVLFASDAGSDMNALELISGIASSVLERKANVALHAQINAAASIPLAKPSEVGAAHADSSVESDANHKRPSSGERTGRMPAWSDLPVDQRDLHIRAQRFARVVVAEMQLARPEACRAGREQGDLYLFLKREIDKARENYRKQFMTVPSMVDYLHLELIQTAAHGDEHRLGADYPGRLL